jgi:hypothetical protein
VTVPSVSGRLVRSFLRYLRERLGDAAFEAQARAVALPGDADWVALDKWIPALDGFEARFGDRATWRLLREMTRATMAAAISKVWSTFLSDATPASLLDRVGTFWSLSYNVGELRAVERGPRRAHLVIEGWASPPPQVVVSVAEACAVFLARLGQRSPRAVDKIVDGRGEVEISWE